MAPRRLWPGCPGRPARRFLTGRYHGRLVTSLGNLGKFDHPSTVNTRQSAVKPPGSPLDSADSAALAASTEHTPPSWMTPICGYLQGAEVPDDDAASERLARKSKLYTLIEGQLYRRGGNDVLMKCVEQSTGISLLSDIHEGVCGNHASYRSLVGKAFRQGFYWPTALQDAAELVQKCESCQFFGKQTSRPAQALQTIPLSWPFSVWGLDILGPFPRAQGGYRFLFVAIDTCTKWIEAEPVENITAEAAKKFIRSIVVHFGVPNRVITDNGSQFKSNAFQTLCEDLGIKLCFASVAHPQSNGQVERANGLVLKGIKTRVFDRLESYSRRWVKELPSVLWALRTTPSRATGETPFFLVYGAEAVLPTELEYGSPRVDGYREEEQAAHREDDVIMIEERRDRALIRVARYQQSLRRYHGSRISERSFQVGDLVLRKIQTTANRNKLTPIWEGPYVVLEVSRPGAYRLATMDGHELPNSWNIDQLRRFYV